MIINTVKLQEVGYLVNGSLVVPNAPGNRHYEDVLEWIALGNTPSDQFTSGELLSTAKKDKALELKESFEEAVVADVLVSGSMYQAGHNAQLLIASMASRNGRGAGNPSTIKDVNGVDNNLTPALISSLEDAMFNQLATSTDTLSIKTGLVNDALDVSEVEAITFAG